MFIDFYSILEISPNATPQEIKSAYRKQSIKWHPDKNLSRDTMQIMQAINQAYLILKDDEARSRYNNEYFKFKSQFEEIFDKDKTKNNKEENFNENHFSEQQKYYYSEYKFDDEVLEKWMDNARKQAKNIVNEAIEEFKGASKEAGKSIVTYFIWIMIPMLIGFLLFKACLA